MYKYRVEKNYNSMKIIINIKAQYKFNKDTKYKYQHIFIIPKRFLVSLRKH